MCDKTHRQNGDNEDRTNKEPCLSPIPSRGSGQYGPNANSYSFQCTVAKMRIPRHGLYAARGDISDGPEDSLEEWFGYDSDHISQERHEESAPFQDKPLGYFLDPVEGFSIAELNTCIYENCFDNNVEKSPPCNRKEAVARTVIVAQRTSFLLRGLTNVLEEHRAGKPLIKEACEQITAFLDQAPVSEELWVKRVKYLLSFPMARYLRNEDPPSADHQFQFKGKIKKWFKNRLIAFNRKNSHLFYSWFQCKRCTLPASESMIQKAYIDHEKALSKPDTGSNETIDEIFEEETFLFALDQIRKGLNREKDVLQAFRLNEGSHSPSTSACFEATRRMDGSFGSILNRVFDSRDRISSVISGSDFLCLRPLRTSRNSGCEIIEERIPCGIFEFMDLRDHFSLVDIENPVSCTIQGIVEPLKIRVISKGESLPYYMMKPLQKALHNVMRDMPCFRLIGREVSPTDLMDLQIHSSYFVEKLGWASIDYKGATDNLSWKYSSRILEYLLQDFSPWYRKLAFRVLGPHYLHYPTGHGNRVQLKALQANGQLMGSILSFVILCIANLGTYCLSTKHFHKSLSLDHNDRLNRVLTNGDDMLFCSPRDVYERHSVVANKIGLEMSVGKAYWHEYYANINSTSYHCSTLNRDPVNATPWAVSFLNTGLFEGIHKVQQTTEESPDFVSSDEDYLRQSLKRSMKSSKDQKIICLINEVVQGALPGRQIDILKKFLNRHREEIALESVLLVRTKKQYRMITRNLFLPISLGGLGVDCPLGFNFRITSDQLWLANQLTKKRSDGQPYVKMTLGCPIPGFEVEDYSPPVVPWQKPFDNDDFFEEYVFHDHVNDYDSPRFWSKSELRRSTGLYTYSDQKRVYLKG